MSEGRYESHWVRLRVENRAGKRSADDVEVLVAWLESAQGPIGARPLDVVPLRWSSTSDTSGTALTRITVPPGLARHVDLLAIDGQDLGNPDGQDGDPVAAIQVQPTPTDDRHLLEAGSHTLHLAVAARDTDTAYFRVEVVVPDRRVDQIEICELLRVSSPIREPPPKRWPASP